MKETETRYAIAVRVDENMHEGLRIAAERNMTSMSSVVRLALKQYLNGKEEMQ